MFKTGLVSVSFRPLTCEKIVKIAAEAGLDAIEWGGDVHVPPGDTARAERVARLTQAAGLSVSSYGSYYRAGAYGEDYLPAFLPVLAAAEALGAPVIRIWAGTKGSASVGAAERARLTEEIRTITRTAAAKKIRVAFECHNDTLTDDYRSSVRLMEEIGEINAKMYWQPNQRRDTAYNLEALRAIVPYLENVHVFHWPGPDVRLPLADGVGEWRRYFSLIAEAGKDPVCMLEFMPDDDPASLPREAAALKNILGDTGR